MMADFGAQADGVEEQLEAPPHQDNQILDEIELPVRPGEVASNLPPLPPSLGSVSGRASTASGYTPPNGGRLGEQDQNRPGSLRSQRSVRMINNRSHPGRVPPREFFDLGARAYTAYGDYEVRRMVAYRHLGLPAPMVNILPTVTPETRDRTYVVRVEAPECEECHQRHTVVAHRLYVMLYAQVPFLCLHGEVIHEIEIDEVTMGPPIFLPARIERLIPDGASQSSGGEVDVDKILRDARAVSSAARTAVEYFRQIEERVRAERFDLTNYPELALLQVYRMRAMVESGAEDTRQDLELRRRYLAGELRDPTLMSVLSGTQEEDLAARRNRPAPTTVDTGLADFLGARREPGGLEGVNDRLQNHQPMTGILPGGV